jgi:hypothetical protein
MQVVHQNLISALWLLWLAIWTVSAFRTKRVVRVENLASRLSHLVPLGIGVALLTSDHFAGPGWQRAFIRRPKRRPGSVRRWSRLA